MPNLTKSSRQNLTHPEKQFLKAIAQGKNGREAAYAAYNPTTQASADSIASSVLKRDRFQRALEKAGLTDAILANAFVEGVKANKAVVVDKKIYDYPDHSTRHQFLKTALVVKGYYRRTDDVEESEHAPLIIKSLKFVNQTLKVEKNGDDVTDMEAVDASIVSDEKE